MHSATRGSASMSHDFRDIYDMKLHIMKFVVSIKTFNGFNHELAAHLRIEKK